MALNLATGLLLIKGPHSRECDSLFLKISLKKEGVAVAIEKLEDEYENL